MLEILENFTMMIFVTFKLYSFFIRGESHIDFRTQCLIMTPRVEVVVLGGGEAITNGVLNFKVHELS